MSNRLIKTEIIDVADRLEIMYKQMQKNQKSIKKIMKTIDKEERNAVATACEISQASLCKHRQA